MKKLALIYSMTSFLSVGTQPFVPTLKSLNTFTFRPQKNKHQTQPLITISQLVNAVSKDKPLPSNKVAIRNQHTKSIQEINSLYRGIAINEKDTVVTLISRGYARSGKLYKSAPRKGKGLLIAYAYIRDHIVHTPCITFDYNNHRHHLNFAQDLDQQSLKGVYDNILRKNNNSRILLVGECLGAFNALRFAATNPSNIDSIVLISPFFSAKQLMQNFTSYYAGSLIGTYAFKPVYAAFKLLFKNYKQEADTLLNEIHKISGKNIFIAHYKNDVYATDKQVLEVANILQKKNNVHLMIIDDASASHAHFSHITSFQQGLNAFYKTYGLPYKEDLACNGYTFLSKNLSNC